MVYIPDNSIACITMNGEKLEEVTIFKYLRAALSKDGSSTADVRIRITLAIAAMANYA
ncbi:hypothetical protein DPMN_057469 [Dreissena polymorpha]|uniref:Uncharacterized protein n=1 Tax=Dreissena polymorpha TaxID=45954 RepID=A0A9D4HEC3_DREPO|nr:hypothetical protein DPMN_057469 [Dreissena polymorpha]